MRDPIVVILYSEFVKSYQTQACQNVIIFKRHNFCDSLICSIA